MWFKSDEHEKSFAELVKRGRVTRDREYLAALYALAATCKNVQKYVSPGEIHFDELVGDAEPWSSGEKALVKLAATLFNSAAWPVTVQDVFYSLDRDNLRVAMEALMVRYA